MRKFFLLLLSSCSLLVHIKKPEDRFITITQEDGLGLVPFMMITDDFNHDNIPDLAVTNSSATVSVFLGEGDGHFSLSQLAPVGFQPTAIVAGDMNNDGELDLVVENVGSDDGSLLLGIGDGTFQPEVRFDIGRIPDAAAASISVLLSGDINSDSSLDLVTVPNKDDTEIGILFGNGDGSFQPILPVAGRAFAEPTSLLLEDIDKDSFLDLARLFSLNNLGSDCAIQILPGNGDGSFNENSKFPFDSQNCRILLTGDFNNDNRSDFIAVTSDNTLTTNFKLSAITQNTNGSLELSQSLEMGGDFIYKIANTNNDMFSDIIILHTIDSSQFITFITGSEQGLIQQNDSIVINNRESTEFSPSSIVSEDFNSDSISDIAILTAKTSEIHIILGENP